MGQQKNSNHYILMADIIDSSKKKSKETQLQFKKLVKSINQIEKECILSPLTITLGDEFQGVVNSMDDSIRLIISLEEHIIKKRFDLKLRYIVFYGKIETPINKQEAYAMLGPGLTSARKELEKLKGYNKQRFKLILPNRKTLETKLNYCFKLYEMIIEYWKLKDYDLISTFIVEGDYKVVAKKLDKNISLMWRRKESLHIEEYEVIKKLIFLEISHS